MPAFEVPPVQLYLEGFGRHCGDLDFGDVALVGSAYGAFSRGIEWI